MSERRGIRYVHGPLAGKPDTLPRVEAENAVSTGYAEWAEASSPSAAEGAPDAPLPLPPPAKPARARKAGG